MKILSAVAAILFLAVGAMAQTTNNLSDAEIQGRQLAQKLCDARPTENFTNTGILQVRGTKGIHVDISIKVETTLYETYWSATYDTILESNRVSLVVMHKAGFNDYELFTGRPLTFPKPEVFVQNNSTMVPFANSDFWICDLGLEFFHWPEQKILKRENARGRVCKVLESTNPNPSTNGYSRVDSWIDEESGGIVQAKAYDFQGRLLKEFYPKDMKKVDGQWQVQTMEMNNVQTGSRSRIDFDLKSK